MAVECSYVLRLRIEATRDFGRTIIDADSLPLFLARTWRIDRRGYIVATDNKGQIRFHREVLNAPPGLVVDHINGNTSDNRKSNLRLATVSQNMQNRQGPGRNSPSGYRGVVRSRDSKINPWAVTATLDGKKYNLGRFPTKEEAHVAVSRFRARSMPFSVMDAIYKQKESQDA